MRLRHMALDLIYILHEVVVTVALVNILHLK